MAKKIIRTWKGWTTPANANLYSKMLVEEIFPTVKKRGVTGLEKVTITTKDLGHKIEFLLLLEFSSLDAVKSFVGENYEVAYMPENAQKILLDYEHTADHHELVDIMEF